MDSEIEMKIAKLCILSSSRSKVQYINEVNNTANLENRIQNSKGKKKENTKYALQLEPIFYMSLSRVLWGFLGSQNFTELVLSSLNYRYQWMECLICQVDSISCTTNQHHETDDFWLLAVFYLILV